MLAATRFNRARNGFWACSGLAAVIGLWGCSNPPYPRGPVEQLFPQPPRPEDHYYRVREREVHYMQIGGGPARILFIHGSPGDWKAWASYLGDPRLRDRAVLLAVDRPGFGESGPGQVVVAPEDQAALLAPLLVGVGAPTLIVSHSLGGPIAGELALDYPDRVRGAVLVAPSIDPATEHPRWYNRAMTWKMIQWLMPDDFEWSNEELMPLDEELVRMTPRWRDLRVPVTVIQGDKDELVDPRTADFAQRVMPGSLTRIVRVPGQGHFVLWKRRDLVVDEILALLDRTQPPDTPASPLPP